MTAIAIHSEKANRLVETFQRLEKEYFYNVSLDIYEPVSAGFSFRTFEEDEAVHIRSSVDDSGSVLHVSLVSAKNPNRMAYFSFTASSKAPNILTELLVAVMS